MKLVLGLLCFVVPTYAFFPSSIPTSKPFFVCQRTHPPATFPHYQALPSSSFSSSACQHKNLLSFLF